ncbi:hypothetical protein KC353_g49 [Hortaea werneckii]|nr:hypothetical protein KC353_g49 [Hortaea werneckii]
MFHPSCWACSLSKNMMWTILSLFDTRMLITAICHKQLISGLICAIPCTKHLPRGARPALGRIPRALRVPWLPMNTSAGKTKCLSVCAGAVFTKTFLPYTEIAREATRMVQALAKPDGWPMLTMNAQTRSSDMGAADRAALSFEHCGRASTPYSTKCSRASNHHDGPPADPSCHCDCVRGSPPQPIKSICRMSPAPWR